MFTPVPKGSVEIIENAGFSYHCQLPPKGYGKNRLTGEVQFIGVRSVSTKKNEQVWKPILLPDNFVASSKKEALQQKLDPEYYDIELEKIRSKWWLHRLCGEWVMINGLATYIPPSYWFYINCCPLDIGLPTYRNTDKKFYYVWEYCCDDPCSAGLVDIERRRMGKTFKSGSITLDRTSIYPNHHSGIQSKTSTDAKQVFLKTVVNFFKKLPDFFRPIYDQSKGITPTSELRFFQTVVKGKRAAEVLDGEELESWCDWGSSELFHYDGSKLGTYVADEYGKTADVNVWDRWNVVRFCLDQDGAWCGKALFTSTIEEMDSGGAAARKIWDASNPNEKDSNGRTKSGMYRFFLPAYETTFFDKFGMPEEDRAKVYYMNQRDGLRNDTRAQSSLIRKNPFTIDEAFRIDGENSHYDSTLLNERIDALWQDNLITTGNFVWEDGKEDTKVIWVPSKNGRWDICWNFKQDGQSNKVSKHGNTFAPANNLKFVIGCDPFSHNKTVDNRRSDGAALVLMKFDVTDDAAATNMFVCKYKSRPESASIFYEDMIKTAVYYGCQILFENNKNNWDIYFKQRGYESFLMKLDGYPDYGIPGNENTHRQLVEVTEEYINKNINKVFYKDLITDWLNFDMNNTTKFDLAMAAGYTLIADLRKVYKRQTGTLRPIQDYIRKYKIQTA
jgi:hypothetical protein